MLELASLWTYPIKSVRAVRLSSARLGPEGIDGDRRLLVVSAANVGVTQRQQPLLATVSAVLDGRRLSLRAPGRPPLNATLPLEAGSPVTASLFGASLPLYDQGVDVAQWLTALLDAGRPSVRRLLGRPAFKLLAAPTRTRRQGGLADVAPLLVLCEVRPPRRPPRPARPTPPPAPPYPPPAPPALPPARRPPPPPPRPAPLRRVQPLAQPLAS